VGKWLVGLVFMYMIMRLLYAIVVGGNTPTDFLSSLMGFDVSRLQGWGFLNPVTVVNVAFGFFQNLLNMAWWGNFPLWFDTDYGVYIRYMLMAISGGILTIVAFRFIQIVRG